jgi:gamma-glutamyltranspeptidase/glutathione hydrolase
MIGLLGRRGAWGMWLAAGLAAAAWEAPGAASRPPLAAVDGMVVTECPEASRVGAEVLRAGGNAVDAAVAVHFALAVAYPQAGNLGGGGFMLVRMADGTCEAIDFRESAPAEATRDLFLGPDGRPDPNLSTATHLASGTPGSVAGMGLAHERFGTRPWPELLAPSIELAARGFALDGYTAGHLRRFQGRLGVHPEARRVFLADGVFRSEGDSLKQPELAETLRRIARGGPREFYEGRTAALVVAEMERGGGILTAEDLRAYRALVRRPLVGTYRGLTVLTMPPPSSGGVTLLQMLGLLEPHPVGALGALSSQVTHLTVEAMRRAFADRAEFLGDPDLAPIPVAGLLQAAYLDSLGRSILPDRATPSLTAGPGLPAGAREFYEATGGTPGPDVIVRSPADTTGDRETTHFSIVDRQGNAVSVTTTLNTSYGSGMMVTGAGFLLNNEMDDFAAAPGSPNHFGLIQGEANAVRGLARPLSSMAPTIVTRGDTLALVLGSPDGPRIISSVLQVLLNVIDHGMDLQEAVDVPRMHHQWWPDTLYAEPYGMPADVTEALVRRGHRLASADAIGSVQAIQVVTRPGGARLLLGASDPRRNGCPVGVTGTRLAGRCAPVAAW